jgi:RNA polymerase sigma factor (TIGR02999 family)
MSKHAHDSARITQFLIDFSKGNRKALDEMLPLVYNELKRVAKHYLSQERSGHTLQTTALVHEAYIRMVDQQNVDWKNRAHFFSLASEMMRRILVNYARDRAAVKRGRNAQRVSLSDLDEVSEQPNIDLIALDQALTELAREDERKARIVELKFFGGMTNKEISEVLKVSDATVEREWMFARAWLYRAVEGKS